MNRKGSQEWGSGGLAISFVLQFQNMVNRLHIREGSPWVMKSTLLSSTKPESQIPTSTNDMAFTESFQHAKQHSVRHGTHGLVTYTQNTVTLGAKSHTAASETQVLPPTTLASDLQQSFSSRKGGPMGLLPHLSHG